MNQPLLIDNGTVLTGGAEVSVRHGHSVLIEKGYISRIAPQKQFRTYRGKRLDASRKLVLPGFINAHTHFYSTFARGLTRTKPAKDFLAVLKNLWWRLDSALSLEDCYYSAMVPLLESIRHGTTTLIDHHASPRAVRGSLETIARAVRRTGLRACLCYEVSDRDGSRVAKDGLEENAAFIRACRKQRLSTTQPALAALFGLHASFTLKPSTLERAAALGQELGAGFHIHVAEDQSDENHARRHFRTTVLERLQKARILGPGTLAAHCVHISTKEREILAETQTAVVHNPQSNLNNAVGIADLISMHDRGIFAGLGTDAMTTNMLEELRAGIWAQHLRARNPSVGFSELVSTLFQNNARIASRIFGLPLGELREGYVGDAIIIDYDPATPLEADNCFGHLVFGASQATVDTTIVAGRVLMQNKRLTRNLDEARIYARARERAKDLWKKL